MPRLPTFWIAVALACLAVAGCDKGAARQCDERVACPAPQVCDLGSNQCVGENDNVTCSSDANCSGQTPYCYLEVAKCVECLTPGPTIECPERRICNQRACEYCSVDTDCDGGVCQRDGGCAAADTVAFVTQAGTSNTTCSVDVPCDLPAALATNRPVIRATGALVLPATLTITRAVAIYGGKVTRTTITRSGAGPIFDVSGTGKVELRDLELFGATGATGHAILVSGGTPTLDLDSVDLLNNAGQGISAGNASLTLTRSLVVGNAGGGLSTAGAVTLENDIIVKNGGAASTVGGVRLTSTAASNVVRFNTIADNQATGTGTGVSCASSAIKLSSNIFAGNTVATCTTVYSLFPVGTPVTGTNKAGDPRFVTTTLPADRDAPTFYHLMADSAAIGGGEIPSLQNDQLTGDIDGDSRSTDVEIGADEYVLL